MTTFIEFNSQAFLDSCKQEINTKGYCYLQERLSRHAGMRLDYFIENNDELTKLPQREQSLWTILVSDIPPYLTWLGEKTQENLVKTEGYIELSSLNDKVFAAAWADKATIKTIALVYTNNEPLIGVY